MKNNFDKDKVLNEINLQVHVTKDFRKNSFRMIDTYVLPKQAELREKIQAATTEEEKTKLYNEIYKLQYQKRFLETLVNIISADPSTAVTQGTLQMAATKMREISLENSRKSPGIRSETTNEEYSNTSYDSGYFDGVKLGGVRLDLNIICGTLNERCETQKDQFGKEIIGDDGRPVLIKDERNNVLFIPSEKYPTIQSVLDNKDAKGQFGATGGFQGSQGSLIGLKYKSGSFWDKGIESFAGTHDLLGGQIWGFYGKDGNTSRGFGERGRSNFEEKASGILTGLAIPVSAPAALSDLISSDIMQLIFKLGK